MTRLYRLNSVRYVGRTAGITRARVTQIINLTQLAPDIQEAILNLEPTTDHVPRFREREVRTIAILPNWEKQRVLWKRLVKQTGWASQVSRESNSSDEDLDLILGYR